MQMNITVWILYPMRVFIRSILRKEKRNFCQTSKVLLETFVWVGGYVIFYKPLICTRRARIRDGYSGP